MIYTAALQKAIKFSIKTHEIYQQQKRKGKDIPYIVHPLAVGLILATAGAKEDLIIAGILHDTIEDSIKTKKVTQTMLGERFGHKVAELVVSVTEKNKDLDWETRKTLALDDVASFSHESVMLKSADVIQNSNELLADIDKDGDEVFQKFNAPEPKKPKILRHQILMIQTLIKTWPENPLKEDLRQLELKLQEMTFPQYFEVDDKFVTIDTDGDTVFATTAAGRPFPPVMARSEGSRVTEAEFKNAVQKSEKVESL